MTLGQISAREDFAKRIAAEKPVYLHECLYPLMQGWDSVEIRADVELGGTEQLFSLLVARDLQQSRGQEPQVAMTMPILVGTDGVRRMGKSLGNYIGVAEPPNDQFGKVMSIPDEPMRQYFTLLTDLPLAEVDRLLGPGRQPARRQGGARQGDRRPVLTAAEAADARRRRVPPPGHGRGPDGDPRRSRLGATSSTPRAGSPAPRLIVALGPRDEHVERPPGDRAGGVQHRARPRRRSPTRRRSIDVADGLIVRVGKRKIARVALV